jgi:hypothetical protein
MRAAADSAFALWQKVARIAWGTSVPTFSIFDGTVPLSGCFLSTREGLVRRFFTVAAGLAALASIEACGREPQEAQQQESQQARSLRPRAAACFPNRPKCRPRLEAPRRRMPSNLIRRADSRGLFSRQTKIRISKSLFRISVFRPTGRHMPLPCRREPSSISSAERARSASPNNACR